MPMPTAGCGIENASIKKYNSNRRGLSIEKLQMITRRSK
jgi:hypothetical protein